MDTFSKLVCNQPNSPAQPKFNVGASGSKDCLEIQLPDGKPVKGPNLVARHDPTFSHYLAVDKFRGTLQQWINRYIESLRFCDLHWRELKEKRPSEHLRRVLEGIFTAVCNMHRNGSFHGSLRFAKNYVLEATAGYPGIGIPYSVSVTIIHAQGHFSTGVTGLNSRVSEADLERYIAADIADLRHLVFNTILGVDENGFLSDGVSRLPYDLEHLRQIMSLGHSNRFALATTLLYAHPGLWDEQRRVRYYGECLNAYFRLNAKKHSLNKRSTIKYDLGTMSCVEGWYHMIDNLPPVHVFSVVFNKDGVFYKADGPSLVRFAQAVALHAMKDKAKGDNANLYIDKHIRDTFPALLVESHCILARHRILL